MIKRIAATLVIDSGYIVNSYNFKIHLPVGKLKYTIQRLQEFGIDEIIILNTSHSNSPSKDFIQLLKAINSLHISTPIAYGGGITCVSDAKEIIRAGAERVVVSPKLLVNSNTFFEICSYLGEQALVLHVPIKLTINQSEIGDHKLINFQSALNLLPRNWGGEIMISCVASDGAKFPDWHNVSTILECAVDSKNLILAGGFANAQDIGRALSFEQVSAVAVGNYLHREELSVKILKRNIKTKIELRRSK
jgi:cyclase